MAQKSSIYLYLIVVLALVLGIWVGYTIANQISEQKNDVIYQALYFEQLEIDLIEDINKVYEYYDLSSQAYDVSNYESTIFYCEESRRFSSAYSQKLREIKAEYPEERSVLLQKRALMIETEIEYLFALYESCEYIESAARAYAREDYTMGGINIEGQNEAITRHDNLLEDYYNLEAEYEQLKKEILLDEKKN